MKAKGDKLEDGIFAPYSTSLDHTTQRIKDILNAIYDAADVNEIVYMCLHLTSVQARDIFTLLKTYSTRR
jgi:hypothetical protein